LFESQFILHPTERFPTCHAANLALLSDGQLLVVYFSGAREGSADSAILLQRYQKDGSWSKPEIIQYEPGRSAGNAVLMPLHDGKMALFYTLSYSHRQVSWADALIHYRFSRDQGVTWGEQHTLTEEFGFICRQPGTVLANGEWLLPVYDNRGGGKPAYPGMGGNEGSVMVTADQGLHWSRYGRMVADAGLAQPCVVELEPGHLRAWLRTRNYWNGYHADWACLYRCDSHDNGRNWEQPARTGIPNNNSSFQVRRLAGQQLVMVYNHQPGNLRSPLNIAVSYDDGETWPVQRELEPFDSSGNEFSYPAVAQAADGKIHIAYTYLRTHIKHVVCDLEWVTGR